jgi:hypothetical protein
MVERADLDRWKAEIVDYLYWKDIKIARTERGAIGTMETPVMRLRPGDQLASAVCATRVVVIRVPADEQPLLECGGRPMVPGPSGMRPLAGGPNAATLIGKRYVDATETVELLCTSSGTSALTCGGVPMTVKSAKPLPASD